MIVTAQKTVAPLGCSCISQFQLEMTLGKTQSKGGLFDWNVSTPEATLRMIELIASGELDVLVQRPESYDLRGIIVHFTPVPGFFFFHEDYAALASDTDGTAFQALASKVLHLVSNIRAISGPVTFMWTNAQPNLIRSGAMVDCDGANFVLTRDRYERIKAATSHVWPNSNVLFVVRKPLYDQSLVGEDIFVKDVPESDDYIGSEGFFEDAIRSALS